VLDRSSLIPRSKFDLEAATRATDAGWPAVEPVISELLRWCLDSNWPVAQVLGPFIGGLGSNIVPHVQAVLDDADAPAKHHILAGVVSTMPTSALDELRAPLARLINSPTAAESAEDLPSVASRLLSDLDAA
jgi:hypothetical protein